jgi:hypothetical protein
MRQRRSTRLIQISHHGSTLPNERPAPFSNSDIAARVSPFGTLISKGSAFSAATRTVTVGSRQKLTTPYRQEPWRSSFHLPVTFRYSNRVALGVDDCERATCAIQGAEGKPLLYTQPRSQEAETGVARAALAGWLALCRAGTIRASIVVKGRWDRGTGTPPPGDVGRARPRKHDTRNGGGS